MVPSANPFNTTPSNIKTTTWPKGLLVVSIIIFAIVLGGFFVLNYFVGIKENKISELGSQIQALQASFPKDKQDEVINFEYRLQNLVRLLSGHNYLSKLFGNLEVNAHPKIYFNNFDFDTKTSVLKLEGIADSYKTVSEAITAFSSDSGIQNVTFKNLKTGANNKVTFSLELDIKPELLKP